jgi:hypothetical protein
MIIELRSQNTIHSTYPEKAPSEDEEGHEDNYIEEYNCSLRGIRRILLFKSKTNLDALTVARVFREKVDAITRTLSHDTSEIAFEALRSHDLVD